MRKATLVLRVWLPLAVAVSGVCALVFGSMQQLLRQAANDPQIQIAEDAAAALDGGSSPGSLVSSTRVDIAHTLAPFLLFYDMNGKPTAGSGLLAGSLPDYPLGALQAARQAGENRVTWQPRPDVRIASVAVPFNAGYVVAGRSLRETERRVALMQTLAFLAWLVTLAASLAVAAALQFLPDGHAAG